MLCRISVITEPRFCGGFISERFIQKASALLIDEFKVRLLLWSFKSLQLKGQRGETVLFLLMFVGGLGSGVASAGPGSLQAAALLARRRHRLGVLSVTERVLHQPLTAGPHRGEDLRGNRSTGRSSSSFIIVLNVLHSKHCLCCVLVTR